MVRRTPAAAQQTRLRIVAAAAVVFCRQGVSKSTLEDVARQAGVTRGAVYWHFKGKQELLGELLESRQLPLENMMQGATLAEDCEHLTQALLATLRDPGARRIVQILLQKTEWGSAQPHVRHRIMVSRKCVGGYLTRVLQRALDSGELPHGYSTADIAQLVLAIQAGMTGLVFELLWTPRMQKQEEHVHAIMRLLFGMLSCPYAAAHTSLRASQPPIEIAQAPEITNPVRRTTQ